MALPPVHIATRCEQCQDIKFPNALQEAIGSGFEWDGRRLYLDARITDSLPGLPSLTAAVRTGCDFCAFLRGVLQSRETIHACGEITTRGPNSRTTSMQIALRFHLVYDLPGPSAPVVDGDGHVIDLNRARLKHFVIALFLYKGDDEVGLYDIICAVNNVQLEPQERPDKSASYSLLDDGSLKWVEQTLNICSSGTADNHRLCRQSTERNLFFPTRLVDVRNKELRLVHGRELLLQHTSKAMYPQYAALSYCWGIQSAESAAFRTTTLNESTMMQAFSCSSLPSVLQDAVAVTKALGICYLWIDALCILQDSKADWELESVQLDKIYGSAFVTICSLTPSCQVSFLAPERLEVAAHFHWKANGEDVAAYRLRYLQTLEYVEESQSFNHLIPKNRWLTRGWTFPEAFLSSRMLLCGFGFVAINCPSGLFRLEKPDSHSGIPNIREIGQHNNICDLWMESIALYTRRKFTFSRDILPAISGLAGHFSERLETKYLAGLWESDLIRGLMWRTTEPSDSQATLQGLLTTLRYPNPYISPSWSWVGRQSVRFLLHGSHIELQNECQAIGSTVVNGHNKFGQVSGGEILMTGRVRDMGPIAQVEPVGYLQVRIKLGEDLVLECYRDWRRWDLEDNLYGTFKLCLLASQDIWSVPDDQGRTRSTDQNRRAYGLILQEEERRMFFRVGIFYSEKWDGKALEYFRGGNLQTLRII